MGEANVRLPTADGRRPQQQASLCWQSLWLESTQHPTSPPSKCTADTATSGGGGAPVTHGATALGMEWVEWVVYTFGFTAVSSVWLQMCPSSGQYVTAAAAHLFARWLINTAVAGKPKPKPRFSSKTEPKPIENGKSKTVTTLFAVELSEALTDIRCNKLKYCTVDVSAVVSYWELLAQDRLYPSSFNQLCKRIRVNWQSDNFHHPGVIAEVTLMSVDLPKCLILH